MNLCRIVPIQNLQDLGPRRIRNEHADLAVISIDLDLFAGNAGRKEIVFDVCNRSDVFVAGRFSS
jgi:hypothetical protein